MAAPIATRLILNTKNFQKGLKGARAGLNLLGSTLGKVGGLIGKLTLALTAATAGFTAIVLRSAAYIDRLGKVSKVTGVAVDTLQKFGFAAEQAGVTSDNAALALRRFSRRLGEAQKNTGELLPALRRLGIDTKNADGTFKSAEEVLFEFAEGIKNTQGESAKLALAFKAFDSEGAELVGTLNEGADGLKAMFDRAQALGFVLDEKTIKGVENFNDSLNELQRLIGGVVNRFVGALAPALDELVKKITDFIIETAEAQGGFENFGNYLKDQFLTIMQEVGRAFFNLYRIIVQIFNSIITGLKAVGLAGPIQNLKEEIEDLRGESNKPFFLRFNVASGEAENVLRDALGDAFLLTDENIDIAIAALQNRIDQLKAEGYTDIQLLRVPTDADFQKYYDGIEKFKTKSIEASEAVEEVVVTATQGQKTFFDKLLDSMFSEQRVNDYFAKSEQYAEKATLSIADFIKITFDLLGESTETFFKNIKEKLAASGVGDYMKTLEDGFVKAVQMFEDTLADAIVKGKADFSDLADHIKQVLAKAFIQKFITTPLLGVFNNFLADGGPAKAGRPYIVGEEGPELFIPNQSGTVIPNDELASGRGIGMGGTVVNYNINAIDTRSFQQRLAENPEYIYNLTTVGARRQPA